MNNNKVDVIIIDYIKRIMIEEEMLIVRSKLNDWYIEIIKKRKFSNVKLIIIKEDK